MMRLVFGDLGGARTFIVLLHPWHNPSYWEQSAHFIGEPVAAQGGKTL